MTKELLEEKKCIRESFAGMTLSDIYEERYDDILRLYEIDDELHEKKYETHSV